MLERLLGECIARSGGADEAGALRSVERLRGGEHVLVRLRRGKPGGLEEILAVVEQLGPGIGGDRQLRVTVAGQFE